MRPLLYCRVWASACLECSLDVIIHHFDVGLAHADGTPGQAADLVDGHILQLGAVVPALLQDQQHLLQQARCRLTPGVSLLHSKKNLVNRLAMVVKIQSLPFRVDFCFFRRMSRHAMHLFAPIASPARCGTNAHSVIRVIVLCGEHLV